MMNNTFEQHPMMHRATTAMLAFIGGGILCLIVISVGVSEFFPAKSPKDCAVAIWASTVPMAIICGAIGFYFGKNRRIQAGMIGCFFLLAAVGKLVHLLIE